MAYKLEIPDSRHLVKVRSPLAVALLSIVTLGIYHVVWWYKINRELRDYGRARGRDLGDSPALSTLAVFPGGLIIIPALVTAWRGTERVQGAARISNREPLNGWIALILFIVIGVGWAAYLQSELNKVWRTEGVPLPGETPPPALDDGMPPPLPSEPAQPSSSSAPLDPQARRSPET
jgi:Domain of unknown function (DUF4234)